MDRNLPDILDAHGIIKTSTKNAILLECRPTFALQGDSVAIEIVLLGANLERVVIIEILSPLEEVLFKREVTLSGTVRTATFDWPTDTQMSPGLYRVSAGFKDAQIHSLTYVLLRDQASPEREIRVQQALERYSQGIEQIKKGDHQAALDSFLSSAQDFSIACSHESALDGWRDVASLQLSLGDKDAVDGALHHSFTELFEVVRTRLTSSTDARNIQMPPPERLPLRYLDIKDLWTIDLQHRETA